MGGAGGNKVNDTTSTARIASTTETIIAILPAFDKGISGAAGVSLNMSSTGVASTPRTCQAAILRDAAPTMTMSKSG